MKRMLLGVLCALTLLWVQPALFAADFKISGWHEAVVSVRKLEDYKIFFTDIAEWRATESGTVSAEQLKAWGLPKQLNARYQVYANEGTARGYVRLVEFSGAEPAYMRLDSQAWDTGGIYDINIRARDLDAAASKLRRIGWQAKAPVNQFSFGPFVVKEWIVRSPDGFELALIERIKPELKGWPLMKAMSRSFNSTQIVKDMSTSMHFYEKVLGFQRYLEHKGASKVAGPNVLGMPQNSARQVEREIYILSPDKSNEGSIELLQFHGLDGADYSQTSHFPNLGIGLLRLPVENIEALQVHLIENQVEFVHRVKTLGSEKKMVVKAPEGAWLEFYESAEND